MLKKLKEEYTNGKIKINFEKRDYLAITIEDYKNRRNP